MGQKLLIGLLLLAPLAFYPFLRDTKDYNLHNHYVAPAPVPVPEDVQNALHAFCAAPGQTFPACIPWEPIRVIAQDQSRELEELAKKDPVRLLERGLERYQQEVQAYKLIFMKHEKVNGKLKDAEVIRVHFREKPFSVHMNWIEGIDLAYRSLFVQGENQDCILARPCLIGGLPGPIMTRALDAADVKSSSRFPVTSFGLYEGAKSTITSIHAAQKAGTLYLRYDGIESVEKAGNRLCYKFVRYKYEPPEEKESLNELTIYIDRATLFQVGSILRDVKGGFIAEYFFRDIEMNPTFEEKQFTKKSL